MSLFGKVTNTVKGAASGASTGGSFGAALGAFGGFLGNAAAVAPAVGAYLSYKQQDALLQKQMDFQERMSNTAHQREVADLVAAGINPLYTATGGNGATTPMGSTGSQTDFANAFSSGIGMATSRKLQMAMQKAQFESMAYDNSLKHQQTQLNIQQQKAQQIQNEWLPKRLQAEIDLMHNQGVAALASGAASSANASYIQQQRQLSGFQSLLNNMDEEFLRKNPGFRQLASFLRTTLGSSPNLPYIGR